jgi:hypothetical protein
MKRLRGVAMLVAVVAGCAEEPLSYDFGGPLLSVMQGNEGGVYFLPPLLQSTYSGTFAPDRDPVVLICAGLPVAPCADAVAVFDMVLDEGETAARVIRVDLESEHYIVNWKTAGRPQGEYRIFVMEHGAVQAFIDIVLGRGGDVRTLRSEGHRVVGGSLPIVFRMEQTEGGSNTPANGLFAQYFDWRSATPDFNVAVPILERVDPVIDFRDPVGDQDVFGVGQSNQIMARWTGFVVAPVSSLFTLCVTTDDGVRLWLNGFQFINQWVNQTETMHCSSFWMEAGERYPIRLEWYNASGPAVARLSWQNLVNTTLEIIPSSALRPE